MRKKIIKIAILILGITLIALATYKTTKNEMSVATTKLANSGTLVEGEKDPNTYNYKTHTGQWDATKSTGDPALVPVLDGFQIYCSGPGAIYSLDNAVITYTEAKKLTGYNAKYDYKLTYPVYREKRNRKTSTCSCLCSI